MDFRKQPFAQIAQIFVNWSCTVVSNPKFQQRIEHTLTPISTPAMITKSARCNKSLLWLPVVDPNLVKDLHPSTPWHHCPSVKRAIAYGPFYTAKLQFLRHHRGDPFTPLPGALWNPSTCHTTFHSQLDPIIDTLPKKGAITEQPAPRIARNGDLTALLGAGMDTNERNGPNTHVHEDDQWSN